jgi:hydroxyacylglutathione hydrolase
MHLDLVTVACLRDNYAYLVVCPETGEAALVDAPEAAPIAAALRERGLRLTHILLTHHHADHTDAVAELRAGGAQVIGAAADAHRLPPLDKALRPGERFEIFGEDVHVMAADGHTLGHIAYHVPALGAVFTGDSLMALGCGRLFEGSAAQMWQTLSALAALPEETLVCSGHEYTLSNARFALTIEPGNTALTSRLQRVEAARSEDRPTVPSLLSEELETNPFLRAGLPALKSAIGMQGEDDAAVFAEIRRRKDEF